jgi:hypothetical protein
MCLKNVLEGLIIFIGIVFKNSAKKTIEFTKFACFHTKNQFNLIFFA